MTNVQPILATFFSPQDMLLIFLVILLLFGAKKLPELAKGMGQAVREFTKAKDDIEKEITKPTEPPVIQPKDLQEHKPLDTTTVTSTAPMSEPVPHDHV